MDRKLKKKIIRARVKKHRLIAQHAEQHAAELERQQEQDEENRKNVSSEDSPGSEVKDVVFSAKMQKIRNRLTNKKRMAKDRWNRFAGTSGGGAKGR